MTTAGLVVIVIKRKPAWVDGLVKVFVPRKGQLTGEEARRFRAEGRERVRATGRVMDDKESERRAYWGSRRAWWQVSMTGSEGTTPNFWTAWWY
jgi:hypothetical protein